MNTISQTAAYAALPFGLSPESAAGAGLSLPGAALWHAYKRYANNIFAGQMIIGNENRGIPDQRSEE